jgi:hypothetical protein
MPAVTGYIARLSWLLRQGKPANQVALLLPTDDAWAGFKPGKVSVTAAMQTMVPGKLMNAVLAAGYNIDFIDAEAIDRQGFGDHTLLLLPPTDRIPVKTLHKIHAFLEHGGHAEAIGKLPTLEDKGTLLPNAAQATQGIVLTPDAESAAKELANMVQPDFAMRDTDDFTRGVVGFLRRRLAAADVYFVANTSNRTVHLTAEFATRFTTGQQWSPDNGDAIASEVKPSGVLFELAPYQSRVFVFSANSPKALAMPEGLSPHPLADLSQDWSVRLVAAGIEQHMVLPFDWEQQPATQHYSGEAVYTREVKLACIPGGHVFLAVEGGEPEPGAPDAPANAGERAKADLLPNGIPNPLITRPGPGMHAWYLAPIREAALVSVNGRPARYGTRPTGST